MPVLTITPDLDQNPWRDLKREALEDRLHVTEPFRVGCLPGGMVSGKVSVMIAAPLPPDGEGKVRWVFIETSLSLFLMAADAFRARYGENAPRGKDS